MAKTIIDTDVGCDDAMAILMCLRSKSDRDIIGISTVFGNVHVDQATRNAAALIKHAAREDIKIFKGAQDPIIGCFDATKCWSGHGSDGIGGQGLSEGVNIKPQDEVAALALIRAAKQFPGQLEILALGPLTNIALALKLDPSFADDVKHVMLTLMGGCELGKGNSSNMAEFNFHADPEAAHVVLNAFRPSARDEVDAQVHPRITMVTWEVTMDHILTRDFYEELVPPKNATPEGVFLAQVCTALMDAMQGFGFLPCDAYAAAVLEDPSIITKSTCDIELGGTLARGACAFDWYSRRKEPANVRVVQALDLGKVQAKMRETFVN